MKTYHIRRHTDGIVRCQVQEPGQPPYDLPHIVYHSPTGFEVGYVGSGPADLALSLLNEKRYIL